MKKDSLNDKIMKLNEQRFATIVILCNVLDTETGVSNTVKSAICASLINMLDRSMNPDDEPLINLINNSIDNFCAEIEAERGIKNYRDTLTDSVEIAKQVVDELNKKAKRIREGEDILKGICLN
jgi:hypothetical protein